MMIDGGRKIIHRISDRRWELEPGVDSHPTPWASRLIAADLLGHLIEYGHLPPVELDRDEQSIVDKGRAASRGVGDDQVEAFINATHGIPASYDRASAQITNPSITTKWEACPQGRMSLGRANGANIAKVIRADLDRCGLFRSLDPAAFIDKTVGISTSPNFANWKAINAQALVAGQVQAQADGRLRVDYRLWDVFGESQMLSVREAAHRLGVSRRTLERLVNRKQFPPPMKIGVKSLYLVEDIQAFVEKLKQSRSAAG